MHKANTDSPNMSLIKVPVSTQDISERVTNFHEVVLGYTKDEAMEEAARCLNCPGRYCAVACPINTPIPEFIEQIRNGDLASAYELISNTNPMDYGSCRVCAQESQCEKNCTRGIKGEPTAIGRLERFVVDWHRSNNHEVVVKPALNGKCVVVVGSGPAGLACAKELAQAGYTVHIYESRPYAGGVPAYGIPKFVLPDEIITEYLNCLDELGVVIHLNKAIDGDFSVKDLLTHGHDAVFVATGTDKPMQLGIPGETLETVYTASDYLLAARKNPDSLRNKKHRTIAVVGGGNTAIDVCRSAKRLGAEKVYLLYRRTREEMPARLDEIKYAQEEGIEFCFLTQPVGINESVASNGEHSIASVKCTKMEVCEPDYPSGRMNVKPLLDEEFDLKVDALVTALGFCPVPMAGLPTDEKGYIKVKKDGVSTFMEGVFAGGDVVGKDATLISAVAAGKKAAQAIDKYISKKNK